MPTHGISRELQSLVRVYRSLRRLEDGHFPGTVTCLLLAILTGRNGLCISGVFGAGKTRAAAALIGGLLVMVPSLNIMVMTKENAAAQAFADHFLSLGLPDSIVQRAGRLVGYMESNKVHRAKPK